MKKTAVHPSDTMTTNTGFTYTSSAADLSHNHTQNQDPSTETYQSNLDFAPAKDAKVTKSKSVYKRQDVWLWVAGIVFILVVMGMIAAVGNARGWDADTSYEHNQTQTSQDR